MRERYEMVPWVLVVIGIVGVFFGETGSAQKITKTSFSCNGRGSGYYADVATGCQVYHMCDGLGRQFSYTCPNATLFQQRMLICDHWYMVNCSRATADYSANLLIGQRDRPFVEDSETNPYSRTPRPDLLDAPTNLTEFNIIYRTGEQNLSPRDFVGVESEDESVTDQPTYFPPSHWSTEISKQRTTLAPLVENNRNKQNDFQRRRTQSQPNGFQRRGSQVYQNNFDKTPQTPENNVETRRSQYEEDDGTGLANSRVKGKAIDVFSSNKNRNNVIPVNFKSNFKATTPVYPLSVEDTTRTPNNIGLLPPNYDDEKTDYFEENELPLALLPPRRPQTDQEVIIKQDNNNAFKINFPSNYKATTPVYPSEDELGIDLQDKLPEPLLKINFRSNFSATTPVYPNEVELTSIDPDALGILPPKGNLVNFQSNFKATTPQYPNSVEPTSPEPGDAGVLPPKESDNNILVNFESKFKATTPNYPTFVEQTSSNPSDVGLLPPKGNREVNIVNFVSNFKATTPNYPTFVDSTSPEPGEAGVLPPKDEINGSEDIHVNFESKFKATTPKYPNYVDATSPNPNDVGLLPPKLKVAYKSRFRATTPKYPSYVEATSPNPSDVGLVAPRDTVVNFHSDFRATTPNYPTHVDATSPDPGQAGLLAPQSPNVVGLTKSNHNVRDTNKDFSDNFDLAANYYQPTNLEPDYVEGEDDLQEIPGIRLSNFMKSFNREQWQELRHAFKIPEYDFPLDDATRPSYDSVVNSFEPIRK